MKLCSLLLLLLVMASAGCQKKPAPLPDGDAAAAAQPWLPTCAQPPLPTVRLWVGTQEMQAEMCLTGEQQATGMMFRTNMAENAGMIFVFPVAHRASFWMMNTLLPLSAAYIDPNGRILEIHDLEPHNTNSVVANSDNVLFVVEANRGWFQQKGIAPGTVVRTDRGSLRETFFPR